MSAGHRAGWLRRLARESIERTATASGLLRARRYLRRGHSLVLAYHNVVPDDAPAAGDGSLHLRVGEFAAQLDHLVEHADVVPLAALLDAPRGAGRARLRVAITFDDAYAGAVQGGVAELTRRRLPATICVTPGRLGGDGFWWDRIAAPGGEVSPTWREHAIESLAGDDASVLRWAHESGIAVAPARDALRPATRGELREALAMPGITAAAHTWTHPNLARLDADALGRELAAPLEWARAEGVAMLPVLTYPYGRWSADVVAAARHAGYRAAFRVEGGARAPADAAAHDADARALQWPRLNVPAGVSARGFALRVAGLL